MIYTIVGAVVLMLIAAGYYWRFRPRGLNLQNLRMEQITNSGNVTVGALSPDRRYIVYVQRDGGDQSLWVQQLATGSTVQLLPPDQVMFVAVSFTPDGNYVMFVRSDKNTQNFRYLYQIPVLGGTPKQLIRDIDSAPTFSPDGREFVFVRGILDPPQNHVLVANADGSGEHLLASSHGFAPGAAHVAWSPDGKTIATISPETREGSLSWVLQLISRKTGDVRDVHAFPMPTLPLDWLPDGSGLMAVGIDRENGRGQIWFVSLPRGDVRRFTSDLSNYDFCCLAVTHDGDSLLALQNTVLERRLGGKSGWLRAASGNVRRTPRPGAGLDRQPIGCGQLAGSVVPDEYQREQPGHADQ
jgi:Tol biopolymer transport system component